MNVVGAICIAAIFITIFSFVKEPQKSVYTILRYTLFPDAPKYVSYSVISSNVWFPGRSSAMAFTLPPL